MHANAQIHEAFAKVSVPVTGCSGKHICCIDVNDNELCMLAKAVEQISEPREVLEKSKSVTVENLAECWRSGEPCEVLERCWKSAYCLRGAGNKALVRLQDAVAKALLENRALTIPSCSMQLTGASAERIDITFTTFSEKILDVDLKTTLPPVAHWAELKSYQILSYPPSKIELPDIEEMHACLGGWQVIGCYWEIDPVVIGSYPCRLGRFWLLILDLQRDSCLVKPATVMVELRSMGCDVIGAAGPVEPHVFATESEEVIDLDLEGRVRCEFGPFDFKAFRKNRQVGRCFALRIRIFEVDE